MLWRYIHNSEDEGYFNASSLEQAMLIIDGYTNHREWCPWRKYIIGIWIKECGDNFVYLIKGKSWH